MSAVLTADGLYRYALWRDTGTLGGEGTVLFVMLNPSTADAETDDNTIRRCLGFARDWGYARLAVANLYAFRATDPSELEDATDPVGLHNDEWLRRLALNADRVIVAWGCSQIGRKQAPAAIYLLTDPSVGEHDLFCLAQTKDGSPQHPLYVPRGAERQPYTHRAVAT